MAHLHRETGNLLRPRSIIKLSFTCMVCIVRSGMITKRSDRLKVFLSNACWSASPVLVSKLVWPRSPAHSATSPWTGPNWGGSSADTVCTGGTRSAAERCRWSGRRCTARPTRILWGASRTRTGGGFSSGSWSPGYRRGRGVCPAEFSRCSDNVFCNLIRVVLDCCGTAVGVTAYLLATVGFRPPRTTGPKRPLPWRTVSLARRCSPWKASRSLRSWLRRPDWDAARECGVKASAQHFWATHLEKRLSDEL